MGIGEVEFLYQKIYMTINIDDFIIFNYYMTNIKNVVT